MTFVIFTGGLVLATYTISIWPDLVDRVTTCNPAIMGFSALFYIVEVLFFVWTVAYNFVPGGVHTREHTDWLIGFIMVTIGLAMFTSIVF